MLGAPFDSVACAGLRCAVVGAGAVDVDEHFARVVVTDVAEARDGAAV